ncbi:MAG: XRE family transcriptional regulator [Myxococcaceae bacterium]
MAKPFKLLRDKMRPEDLKKAQAKAKVMLAEMHMQELRKARLLSQEDLARILGTKQASISKLEHRADIYISTLRGYIEAMGGHLKIIAQFNDSEVVINQFQELGKKHTAAFS